MRTSRLTTAVALVTAAVCAASLTACSNSNTTSTEAGSASSATDAAGDSSGGTVTITDAQDRTVTVPKNPQTVVALDFSVLQTMEDFGVEAAGVPEPLALPDSLKKYDNQDLIVGSVFEPNYEKIAALNPDLVLIGGRSGKPEIIAEMEKITPNVLDMTVRPKDPAEKFSVAEQRINDIAAIFGKEAEAKDRMTKINSSIEALKKSAEEADRTAIVTQVTGPKVSAYGPGSRFGFVYDQFGFPATDAPVNEKGEHGQEVSQELFVKYNPQVIFYLDRGKATGQPGAPAQEVLSGLLVGKSDAGSNDRLIEMDGFAWYIATNAPSSIEQMIADSEKAVK